MSASKLVVAEITSRPVNFVLSILAVVAAATLFVAGPTLLNGYAGATTHELDLIQAEADQLKEETEKEIAELNKKTRRIMRDLGVNLRIVHKDTNMGGLYTDFVAKDFDEDYVNQLADAPSIETIVHVVATLQHKMKWNGRTILLVGTLPKRTLSQKNEEKPHMVKEVAEGTAIVGYELAGDSKPGDEIEIEGHKFTIAKVMPEYGGLQDIQLVLNLHDAQKVAGKEGKINQIMALNCKCKGDRISVIRKELEGVLPDTKVTELKPRAEAREKQRDLVEQKSKQQILAIQKNRDRVEENRVRQQRTMAGLVNVSVPLVVLVTAVFIGLMTWLNVRERRTEIGVLRALGKGSGYVAVLFLGKAIVLGLVGGLIGSAVGYFVALSIGGALDIERSMFKLDYLIFVSTVIGAPLVTAMASYLPTLVAVQQDPAVVLMEV